VGGWILIVMKLGLRESDSEKWLHKTGTEVTEKTRDAMRFYTRKQAGHTVKRLERVVGMSGKAWIVEDIPTK